MCDMTRYNYNYIRNIASFYDYKTYLDAAPIKFYVGCSDDIMLFDATKMTVATAYPAEFKKFMESEVPGVEKLRRLLYNIIEDPKYNEVLIDYRAGRIIYDITNLKYYPTYFSTYTKDLEEPGARSRDTIVLNKFNMLTKCTVNNGLLQVIYLLQNRNFIATDKQTPDSYLKSFVYEYAKRRFPKIDFVPHIMREVVFTINADPIHINKTDILDKLKEDVELDILHSTEEETVPPRLPAPSTTDSDTTTVSTVSEQTGDITTLDAIDYADIMKRSVKKEKYADTFYPVAIPFELGFRFNRMKYNPITESLFIYVPSDTIDDDVFIKNLCEYENITVIRPIVNEDLQNIYNREGD